MKSESRLKTTKPADYRAVNQDHLTILILFTFLEFWRHFVLQCVYKIFQFIFNESKDFPAIPCNMNATCQVSYAKRERRENDEDLYDWLRGEAAMNWFWVAFLAPPLIVIVLVIFAIMWDARR